MAGPSEEHTMKSRPVDRAIPAAALLCSLIATPAEATDKELLDILFSNGAIDRQQYERLLAKEEIDKADVDEVIMTLNSDGFRVRSADGRYSIRLGTRLHAELSQHVGDMPEGFQPVNGSELRRARIETSGSFDGNWSWAAQVDFADNQTSVKDFWLGYTTAAGTKFSFGSQKQPYSLLTEMNSDHIPFVERSVDTYLLAPFADRAVGFRVEKAGQHWFAAGGIFGEAVNPNNILSDEGWGLAGRFVYAPVIEEDQVLHLGVRALLRAPANLSPSYRIVDETTHMSRLSIVDSGVIDQVDKNRVSGIEAAYARGPFSIVGEYSALATARDGAADLHFDSWHVYTTWSITGESRASAYRIGSGEFKGLKPATEFDPGNGGWGAWEVAVRYANINLNDGAIVGGEEDVMSSGLNWYMNDNVRLMIEWSRILATDGSNAVRRAAEGLDIYQFRAQYTF